MHDLSRVLIAALFFQASVQAAASLVKDDPFKGVVIGNAVLTYTRDNAGNVVFIHVSDQILAVKQVRAEICSLPLGRWHVGYGGFWVNYDARNDKWSPAWAGLTRIDLPSLLAGKLAFLPNGGWIPGGECFSYESPVAAVQNRATDRDLTEEHQANTLFVHYDFLPFGKFKARVFILTNIPPKPLDDKDCATQRGDIPAPPEKKRPPRPWTFTFHRYEGRWLGKEEEPWEQRLWVREGTITVGFKEPFQALSLGDDYYFVTRSGSLFRAAKPAKGTDRVLTRVWAGKKQPIKAFITDAKTGKTFLFVPPAQVGGKHAFFELSAKPKLVEYDPKLVPMPPLAEPHRTIVHAARILVALKKIKGK